MCIALGITVFLPFISPLHVQATLSLSKLKYILRATVTTQKRRLIIMIERNVEIKGPWCGQVVSVLAFYSDNPSSNPADVYSFFL